MCISKQVVKLHRILEKAAVKASPTVLWCYKKDLGFGRCVSAYWLQAGCSMPVIQMRINCCIFLTSVIRVNAYVFVVVTFDFCVNSPCWQGWNWIQVSAKIHFLNKLILVVICKYTVIWTKQSDTLRMNKHNFWLILLTVGSFVVTCNLPPTKEEVHVFARVCLFVCLSVSKITQKSLRLIAVWTMLYYISKSACSVFISFCV